MKLDKFGKNLVANFIKDIKDNGVVCKQDVLSLENQVEGVISIPLNINAFTTMKSSTGVKELVMALESLMSSQEEEPAITVDTVVENIRVLKNKVTNILERVVSNNGEYDQELISNILQNHYLSVFNGNDGMSDMVDSNIDSIVDNLLYIIDSISKDKDDRYRARALEGAHNVGKVLYEKPKNMYALLRMTLSNELKIHMETTEMTDVTLRDLISEFVVNDRLVNILINLRSELAEVQTSLLFDYTYDNSLNNETVFTYNDLNKRVDNLKYLIEDDISIYIISLFKDLLKK